MGAGEPKLVHFERFLKSSKNIKVDIYYRDLNIPGSSWNGPYSDTISSLPANSSVTKTSSVGLASGDYEFKVVVDPNDEIDEKSETNNEAVKDISF